jgi:galactokinase
VTRAFRSPGRVNLIGEHTDYNLGFVLPIAVDLASVAITAPATDGRLRIYTEDLDKSADWAVADLAHLSPSRDWTDYVVGVARQLIEAGYDVAPQSVRIRSTVPIGSGLSSSAALEVSTALAMLGGRPIEPLRLAQLCQRAEREFVGVPSGIMDQYVAVFGQESSAIAIDCRNLTHKVVALPPDVDIVAVNSMVKHELGRSAYRERTEQCAVAVEAIRARSPQVSSLRDVDMGMLGEIASDTIRRRARHVVSEDERVGKFVDACGSGDLGKLGELFVESHRSLQSDYEVSCDELDFLVSTAMSIEGVYGARMTGGGFGGCTVNLVDPAASARFEREIARRYEERYSIRPQVYRCRPSAGASEIHCTSTP